MKDFLKFTLATIVGLMITGVILLLILVGVVASIISSADRTPKVENNSVLHLKLEGQIVERSTNNPFENFDFFGMGTKSVGLNDILKSIKNAKADSRIKGIYLDPMEVGAGMATAEEIRNALIDFKQSGKFVYAYGDILSQKAYYLVSAADKVILNPQGILDFKGLGGERNFFKKGLEKLGVEMQIIRHGKFKAAVEPFMREDMSPENKEQTLSYLKGIWNEMLKDIASSRKLSVEQLNEAADMVASARSANFALDKKLVDELKYYDQVLDDLKQLSGIDKDKDIRFVEVKDYKKVPPTGDPSKGLAKDKIAVIYASGEIDGTSTGIDSKKLSEAIRQARTDKEIKAVVLRINSPGGSAFGSEVIWREVKLTGEVKPIIASMSDVAASGGYYIAAAADTIMADRTTITGSIGIFGMIPNVKELFNNKLGITQDFVGTNQHSDMPSVTRPMTTFERDLMQARIEEGYDTFITRVAEGRKMTKQQVDDIGQGRVWASTNAMQIHLVDLYGGVTEAIQLAGEMAHLEKYRVAEYPKLEDPFEMFIKEFTESSKMKFVKSELGENYRYYEQLKEAVNSHGIMARVPYDIDIQ